MKIILQSITLLFFFTLSTKVYSQLDTLNYLKQFEVDKVNYINQPLSNLLNHMTQIKPTTVGSLTSRKGLVAFSLFRFREKDMQYGRKNITMIIYWKNPLSYSQANQLSKQNKFDFTLAEQAFYGDKIIKDIKVYRN